jgi:hypothetical protein
VTVVADASPLIALAQIDQLPLLEKLFGEILVPPAVVSEVEQSLPAFIRERKLSRPIPAAVLRAALDPGESEAISLALEIGAERLILDERNRAPASPGSRPACLQGGANVREIQKLLGHRHLTTTALYTRVDVRGLAAMLHRCHPRERG